jgi:hypothetical protein
LLYITNVFLGVLTVNNREKINKSIPSGAGEDDISKPSLWYFNSSHFLNDPIFVTRHNARIDQILPPPWRDRAKLSKLHR